MRFVGFIVGASVIVAACGGGEVGTVGKPCNSNSECSVLPSGQCVSEFGVCSGICSTHTDCGCADGTTNGDIANGKCQAACAGGACVRVCANNAGCFGSTKCLAAVDSNMDSLGYSICD